MDLKTGRASSWKKEQGGGSFARPDIKLDVIEFNGTYNTNVAEADAIWQSKGYGEAGGGYSSEFGDGTTTDPVFNQTHTGFNPVTAAFNTFGRAVKIVEANVCFSKQGGSGVADSTMLLAICYLDVRNVTDLEGGEVAAGSAFNGIAKTFSSTLLAKTGALVAPNVTHEFQCHDLNSTFKGLTIPEGCMCYIVVKDTTGGTNNAVGINGALTVQML